MGGRAVLRAPLFRIVRHDVQGGLQGADMDFGDLADVADERPRLHCRLRYRLRILAEREPLDRALHDLEGLAVTAKRRQFEGLTADGLQKSALAFEQWRRSCDAA